MRVLQVTTLVASFAFVGCSGGVSCGVGADSGDNTASSALKNDESPGNSGDHKTTICHATHSETNPYVTITVDDHALTAHRNHQDGEDIIPAPAGGCPGASEGEGEGGGGEGEGGGGEGEGAFGVGEGEGGGGDGGHDQGSGIRDRGQVASGIRYRGSGIAGITLSPDT